jgi:hypothetical protein
VAIVGTAAAFAIFLAGRGPAVSGIGPGTACTLAMVAVVGMIYAAIAVAEVVSELRPDARPPAPETFRPAPEPSAPATPPPIPLPATPTYAELCPALPNPLDIGHGLGELFQWDGAVKAGCGTPARPVLGSPPVWVSAGICSQRLRSFGVISPGYAPVLLYGEPALFAQEAARDGSLLFADAAEPGGGEVDVVGTESGTYFFARSSPSISPGREDAQRCSEVGGEARPFVRLSTPLAALWLCHIRQSGWAWPLEESSEPGSLAFLDYDTGELTPSDGCDDDGISCHPDENGGWSCTAPANIFLTDFAPYMPPHLK